MSPLGRIAARHARLACAAIETEQSRARAARAQRSAILKGRGARSRYLQTRNGKRIGAACGFIWPLSSMPIGVTVGVWSPHPVTVMVTAMPSGLIEPSRLPARSWLDLAVSWDRGGAHAMLLLVESLPDVVRGTASGQHGALPAQPAFEVAAFHLPVQEREQRLE